MISTILLDVAPVGGGFLALFGVAFFFILAAVAFVAYRLLRKTVKMAVRVTIVVAILLVALVGSMAFLIVGTGRGGGKRPGPPTPSPTAQKPR